jgi:hypothetical protein
MTSAVPLVQLSLQAGHPAAAGPQACLVHPCQVPSQVAHPHPAMQQHQAACQAHGHQACLEHPAWQAQGCQGQALALHHLVACQALLVCQGQEQCRGRCLLGECSRVCRQGRA